VRIVVTPANAGIQDFQVNQEHRELSDPGLYRDDGGEIHFFHLWLAGCLVWISKAPGHNHRERGYIEDYPQQTAGNALAVSIQENP
jgi:hypothetical protein